LTFLVLMVVVFLAVVLSWFLTRHGGRQVLSSTHDHRLDRAIEAAGAAAVTTPLADITHAGRVLVRDGVIVERAVTDATGARAAAAAEPDPIVVAAVLEAARTGSPFERATHIDEHQVKVRAAPLPVTADGVPVRVGIITIDPRAARDLDNKLAVGHVGALVFLAALAWIIGRYSSRVVEELFEQEDRMIVGLAHEVRSPLSRLVAVVDEGRLGLVPIESALKEASTQGGALAQLIDDLVESARVMSGAIPLPQDTIRLDELVAIIASDGVQGAATVQLDSEPTIVVGSRRLLRLAIRNLVRNAEEHAYDKGLGVIRVAVDQQGVTVRDDGPGVAPARLATLQRELPIGRSKSGIGLALTSWIAQAHGGDLRLTNRPEGGFSAQLALPCHAGVPAEAVPDD